MRQHEEGQRREEHQQAQDDGEGDWQVALAVQTHTVIQVLADADDVLLRERVLRGAGDGGGGLTPVVILESKLGKKDITCSVYNMTVYRVTAEERQISKKSHVWQVKELLFSL